MHFKTASIDSIILYFGDTISEKLLDQVQDAYHKLRELNEIIEMTPSYNSLWIHYDLNQHNQQSIKKLILSKLSQNTSTLSSKANKTIEIPTQYNGIDLERVAQHNQLSIKEVINLHTQQSYRVYAIGFMVGFAYLAKLNPRIATPRHATPRSKVPKGAVAIADHQTAIYPQDSAGGWNIIGETDFEDFTSFKVGDYVQFVET